MYRNATILAALEGTEIAGGAGYQRDIRGPSDADVTVTTRSGFERHVGDAGKVIWIPGNESIQLTSTTTVRATVASDRATISRDSPGVGSPGALLYTTERGSSSHAWDGGSARGLLQFRGKGRLTGVRYRGPYHDHYNNPEYPGYIPLDSGDATERRRKRARRYARGINIHSSAVEIDNCEIYGWPVQAIHMGSRGSSPYSPHIHHIYGHDCMMVGYGYVVDVMRGHPTIENSYFNATRHSVDGFGFGNCGYKLESCVFGPSTYSHAVDMHCLGENGFDGVTDSRNENWRARAGGRMEIRNNVFLYRQDIRGRNQECVVIRGVPKDACTVEDNVFPHPKPPARNSANRSPGNAWRQPNVTSSSWGVSTDANGYTRNFIRQNNMFDAQGITVPVGTAVGGDVPDPEPIPGRDRETIRRRAQATAMTGDALAELRRALN